MYIAKGGKGGGGASDAVVDHRYVKGPNRPMWSFSSRSYDHPDDLYLCEPFGLYEVSMHKIM